MWHLSAICLVLFLQQDPAPEPAAGADVVETYYEDGAIEERYEVTVDGQGNQTRNGSYQRWHPGGELAAEGRYEDGERAGKWVFRYENGKREAQGVYRDGERNGKWILYHPDGKKRGQGNYRDGLRSGSWSFWLDDGEPDDAESGEYDVETLSYPSGSLRGEGQTRDGRRHGSWSFFWENGREQFTGEYVDGERAGPWIFLHADGTVDPLMLSGVYEGGSKHSLQLVESEASPDSPAPAGSFSLSDVPSAYGLPGAMSSEEARASAQLTQLLESEGAPTEELIRRAAQFGPSALPWIVERLSALDYSSRDDCRLAVERYGPLLEGLLGGRAFPWDPGVLAGHGELARLTVLRWASLWWSTRDCTAFWELEVPSTRLPGRRAKRTSDLLFDPPFHDRPETGDLVFATPGARRAYAARFEIDRHPTLARLAADDALKWLADHQEADGSWTAPTREDHVGYSLGVSGLALLSFLAAGHTPTHGAYQENVRRGILHLLSQQDRRGKFGESYAYAFIYNHAIDTMAVAEAASLCDSPTLRARARLAVGWILRARNPDSGWRYDAMPTGDNDTSITSWMVQALVAGRWCGLSVSDDAFQGAMAWIEKMTDDSGRIGYDSAGSLSARTEENVDYPRKFGEAMTAAGLLARLLASDLPADELVRKHVALVLDALPAWDPTGASCDMYYWYYACQAMHQVGGDDWKTWREAFERAALPAQRRGGDEAGSWDPIGPWGYEGGRVYATSMMALGLLAESRLARLGDS